MSSLVRIMLALCLALPFSCSRTPHPVAAKSALTGQDWTKAAEYLEQVVLRAPCYDATTDDQRSQVEALVAKVRAGTLDVLMPYPLYVRIEQESDGAQISIVLLSTSEHFPRSLKFTNDAGLAISVAIDSSRHDGYGPEHSVAMPICIIGFRVEYVRSSNDEVMTGALSRYDLAVTRERLRGEDWRIWLDGRLASDAATIVTECPLGEVAYSVEFFKGEPEELMVSGYFRLQGLVEATPSPIIGTWSMEPARSAFPVKGMPLSGKGSLGARVTDETVYLEMQPGVVDQNISLRFPLSDLRDTGWAAGSWEFVTDAGIEATGRAEIRRVELSQLLKELGGH